MRPVTVLFGLLTLVLAGLLHLEMRYDLFAAHKAPALEVAAVAASVRTEPVGAALASPAEAGMGAVQIDYGQLLSWVERPLFRSSRRPPEVAEEPKPEIRTGPDVAWLERHVLVGVVSDGERRSALLRAGGSEQPFELRRGDHLNEWMVEYMTEFSVFFSAEGRVVELTLATPDDLRNAALSGAEREDPRIQRAAPEQTAPRAEAKPVDEAAAQAAARRRHSERVRERLRRRKNFGND